MIPEGIKKVAVICLLKSGDQWLLLERKNPPNQGLYTPVGGKLDPHEAPLVAAKREIWEETGIKVEEMDYCGLLVETSPVNYNWVSFVYLAEVPYVSAPLCNEGTLHWVKTVDLESLPMPSTDLHIYRSVLEGKRFNFFAEYNKKMEMLHITEALHS